MDNSQASLQQKKSVQIHISYGFKKSQEEMPLELMVNRSLSVCWKKHKAKEKWKHSSSWQPGLI